MGAAGWLCWFQMFYRVNLSLFLIPKHTRETTFCENLRQCKRIYFWHSFWMTLYTIGAWEGSREYRESHCFSDKLSEFVHTAKISAISYSLSWVQIILQIHQPELQRRPSIACQRNHPSFSSNSALQWKTYFHYLHHQNAQNDCQTVLCIFEDSTMI